MMHLPLGLRTLSAGIDYFSRCLTKKSDRVNYRLPSKKDYFTHDFRKTKIKVTATANRHKDAIEFLNLSKSQVNLNQYRTGLHSTPSPKLLYLDRKVIVLLKA